MRRLAIRRFPDEILRRRQGAGSRNQYGEFELGATAETVLPASVQPLGVDALDQSEGERLSDRRKVYVPAGIARRVGEADRVTWNGDALLWNGAALRWGGSADAFMRDDAVALRAAFEDRQADQVVVDGDVFTVESSRSWPSHTEAVLLRET